MSSLLKKQIIKSARFSKIGICTIESEMYNISGKDETFVIHNITDEQTHSTIQYKFGFTKLEKANSYFNSVIAGFLY